MAALITDTTKTGSSSVLGKAIQAVANKSKQAIFQASRKYIENYQKRHCHLKVLGMREPVKLSTVYTGVKLLDDRRKSQYSLEDIDEDNLRKTRLGGYSSSYREDKKQSGIAIANEKPYLMVLGGPGAGKSTLLRKVGLESLRTFYYEGATYRHRLIPVLLELKRFEYDKFDIVEFIITEFKICGFPEAEKFTQNALNQGNLLVLLDGLDEVPNTGLNNVLQAIQDFVDRYASNRFISSCRVAANGHRSDAFCRFSNAIMSDFDDGQIQQFIINWFGSEQDIERKTASKCWQMLQKTENRASKELAHTPLLLTYLCLFYDNTQRFPKNRCILYRKALRILLEEWAADKRILRDDIYEGLSIEQEEILLSEIAYEGMVSAQLFFTKRELSARIKVFLTTNLNAPKHLDSEAVLHAIEVQQGILVERGENVYSFSHITLQEYLTAQYIADNQEWEAVIQGYLTDDRWRETYLLLPGLMPSRSGADNFLIAMEKQASTYLRGQKLRQLVQWVETSTQNSAEEVNLLAKRITAIFFAIELGRALDINFVSILDIDTSIDINITRALTYARNLDAELDLDLSLDLGLDRVAYFSRIGVFSNFDSDALMLAIEKLSKNKSKSLISLSNEASFREKLYNLWLSALSIEPEAAVLSREDSQSLADYFYACELMFQCKEGAMRVSPDVWAGIESRILTVPSC